jgi:hypothetical protein
MSRRVQVSRGAFALFQQRLDAPAERGIAVTSVIEVRCTLLGRQFHRRIKDGGFPLVRVAHGNTILRLPHKARFGKKTGQAIYDLGFTIYAPVAELFVRTHCPGSKREFSDANLCALNP